MNKEKNMNYYTYKLNMTTLNILSIILLIIVGGLVYLFANYNISVKKLQDGGSQIVLYRV